MEARVYDYLQQFLPENMDVQEVDPYLSDVALPKGDFVCFNIISATTTARSQPRELIDAPEDETQDLSIAWDVNKTYNIQVDFYGKNSFDNASIYQHTLQVLIDINDESKRDNPFSLRGISQEIRNSTDLQENKIFLKRFTFNIMLDTIETIKNEDIVISNYELKTLLIN